MASANYNTEIPGDLFTDDDASVDGVTLQFRDGMPMPATVAASYGEVDFHRAVSLFINMVPVASLEAIRLGTSQQFSGGKPEQNWMIFDNLMDSNSLYLTGNTDTVYAFCVLDLEKSGPVVIEVPPGCGPSTINDATFKFVTDMGAPGPDRGEGGKYLILGPNYDGPLTEVANGEVADVDGENYFIAHTPTYTNWVPCRGLLVNGDPEPASTNFRTGIKAYALKDKSNPPAMNWVNGSGLVHNTIHSNHVSFFEEIHRAISKEPADAFDPEVLGIASALGIRKGQPFSPDGPQREKFEEAAATASAYARAVAFAPRNPAAYLYGGENSKWFTLFPEWDYRFLVDDGAGGTDMDSRLAFFYVATVNTPAMVWRIPGVGSQYAIIARDANGEWFDGDKTYTLRIPANVPAKNFWSFVVYDPQTRSMLQTPDQKFPSVNSMREDLRTDADGSVLLTIGPQQPAEGERNWIQTRPQKSWFAILRLYGPEEAWFDKTWRPGEIELTP